MSLVGDGPLSAPPSRRMITQARGMSLPEAAMTESITPTTRTHPLGVSRPDLAVADLPTPEEVFRVRRLGAKELFKYAVGPSLIALGISIGSGEWLLGPQAVGQFGFVGIGWVILISAILQTAYNIECSRYVMATGEVPVVGWGRVPPGYLLWVPVAVFLVLFAFIAGGWAAAARKISRALELANWGMVSAILIALILVDLFIVPFRLWWEGIRGFFTPA